MAPYLSVVVTARNDDHGGNLLGRMQAFVNGLLNQCDQHKLAAELIIVEWNPPQGRHRLGRALMWPTGERYCEVRIIEVPSELHRRFRHWRALPLYQMIAKNVGIRRARGEFILATNVDILFSDELVRFIAEGRLQPNKMYRIDRWDVLPDVPIDAPPEEQRAYCRSHLIRVNSREGTFPVTPDGRRIFGCDDIAEPDGGLFFGSGWFPRETACNEPFRWVENDAEVFINATGACERVLSIDIEPGPGVNVGAFLLELQDESGKQLSSVWVRRRSIVTFALPPCNSGPLLVRLHTRQGGGKISADPRIMNFRVFRCDLGLDSPAANHRAKLPSAPEQTTDARTSRWRWGPEIWPRKREIRLPAEVLSSGLGGIWEKGWYPLEHFKGESFRWMKHQGLLVLLPSTTATGVSLDVEPGPAVGFKPIRVEVRDHAGTMLAIAEVEGRSKVYVPLPSVKGVCLLSIDVQGGGEPRALPGDRRTMALRLFRCEVNCEEVQTQPMPDPFEVGEVDSGVWYTRGWTKLKRTDGSAAIVMSNEAELLVHAPPEADSRLSFVLEPVAESTKGPLTLVVRDADGRLLVHARMTRKQHVHLPIAFSARTYSVLRFGVEGLDGTVDQSRPSLVLGGATWSAGDEPISGQIDPSAVNGAVHLHTNACGDFTLMARDHWMKMRAYPELDLFSMHIDSLFCWVAHHAGVREEILQEPMRIYHIEHAIGSGWTPEGQQRLIERTQSTGVRWLAFEDVLHCARFMNCYDAPMIFNHEDWGFAGEELRENPISPESTERLTEPHPVFAHFPIYSGVAEPGFAIDFLGAKTRHEFLSGAVASAGEVTTRHPPLDEEYFEWIDILESILAAKEKYTVVELGAGYGRWAVRAACAVRRYRPELPFHLIAVEAEPKHFQWLNQHLLDNDIDPTNHTLLQAAVSDKAEEIMFYVGMPELRENVAARWYGQALTKVHEAVESRQVADYEGFEVLTFKSGWQAIKTKCLPLGEIVREIGRVDLIDMDVQGEELKVVNSAIDVLDRSTVRLHIGTHEQEIEDGLRKLLTAHGWHCKADFSCFETNETPWGPVAFSDGVQSWVNPRFGLKKSG